MAVREVFVYPDARLKQVAVPVDNFGDELQTLIDDMLETMYTLKGGGLAATQIGVGLRVIVLDLSNKNDSPLVYVNPRITKRTGKVMVPDDCLSVPVKISTRMRLERAHTIHFEAQDRNGNPIKFKTDGFLGVGLQHEIDHLDGIVFVEKLAPRDKMAVINQLKNRESAGQPA